MPGIGRELVFPAHQLAFGGGENQLGGVYAGKGRYPVEVTGRDNRCILFQCAK